MEYFTADQHFGHDTFRSIRGFKNNGKMDHHITRKYNDVVEPDDICYILGDVSMVGSDRARYLSPIIQKLNGTKILILGNHDRFKPFQYVEMGFQSVHTSLELEGNILIHDPAIHILYPDTPIICGHVHTLFTRHKNCLNVGIDAWDYKPVSIDEVYNLFATPFIDKEIDLDEPHIEQSLVPPNSKGDGNDYDPS